MPANVDVQESGEIKENNTLTKKEEDVILKKLDELTDKINDYYLKPREPLKEDPVFELFDKVNKERE